MNSLLLSLFLVLSLFWAPVHPQATLNALETAFVIELHQSSMFQIAAGDLANRRASSTQLRSAARLITAEQKVLASPILSAATQFNVDLPAITSTAQQTLMSELESASCQGFDALFATQLRLFNGKLFTSIGTVRGSTANEFLRSVCEMANDASLRHMEALEATSLVNFTQIPLPATPAGKVENVVNSAAGVLTEADRDLLVRVRLAGLWEVPGGDLAVAKGQSAIVRAIGRNISDEHKTLNATVAALAAQLAVPIPNEMNDIQRVWVGEMQAATGANFDKIFVDRLRVAHGAIFPAISDVRAGTRNTLMRSFATAANTIVTRHQTYLESTKLTSSDSFPTFTLAPTPASISFETTIPNAAEADLLVRVRLAGLWEIPAGDMAVAKGASAKVREIGAKLSFEHKTLDAAVMTTALKLGVAMPNVPNAEQQGWLAQMEAATGAQFDQLFVDLLRIAHGSIYPMIANIRANTRSSIMRNFAEVGNTFVTRHQTYLESTGLVDWNKITLPPSPAGDNVTTNTALGLLTPGDRDLLVRVRLACLWEIPAGDWAQTRAFSPLVKDAGQRVSAEHQILNVATVNTANLLGVSLPDVPNEQQNGFLAEMQNARTPQEFDQIFIDRLRVAHGTIFPIIARVRAGTRNSAMRLYAEVANAAVTRHMTYLESANIFNFNLQPEPTIAGNPVVTNPPSNSPTPGVSDCDCTESSSSPLIYVIIAILVTAVVTGVIAFFYIKKMKASSGQKGYGQHIVNPIAVNSAYYSSPNSSQTSSPRNNIVI